MDTTLSMIRALKEQQVRNDAYAEAELVASRAEGAQALRDAMRRGDAILVLDEASNNRLYNAFAVGWNSERELADVK
ncbi:hypothetical protein RBA41_31195 [Massilia sp. CCM 9210]|uniref:hypothetical protein n=1 Tax=Massilia scottii TaxID=3057166 RepID=UPI0027964B00|nr:hypothetical protein [Massilia sp. CCM 9210]MDQ1817776.1 hypothetical protein [Massilia sp. CCM 9210]